MSSLTLSAMAPNCIKHLKKHISVMNDMTEFVINKGNGVKGLSEMGLKTLPHQYIQPPHRRITATRVTETTPDDVDIVVVVDMSNPADPEVAKSVCEAAEKWGFFQVINHGIPLQVLDNVKSATHRFFGLSAATKSRYLQKNSPSNNVRYGTSFSPQAEKALEWKDYLSLLYVSEDEASALWPPVCKDQVIEFMKRSDTLIKKLLEILMKRLNVTKIDENKESLLMGSKRINLNYYPICPNPELTVGVSRHSDISTLTLLLQDEIGGLQMQVNNGGDKDQSWIHVRPVSGSIVINIGDALEIMSNGVYKSVEHQVAANGRKNRISIPIFVNPALSSVIGPLPEILEQGEKAVYKQVLYSDYAKHFFKKPHDGKNTLEFAKIK